MSSTSLRSSLNLAAASATLFVLTGAPTPAADLVNGSMAAGDEIPEGWSRIHTETGELSVARDTRVWFRGPASVRLASVGGPAHGNVSQMVDGLAGRVVTVSGAVRREPGITSCQVFAMPFSKDWKSLGWHMLHVPVAADTWEEFSKSLSVPPEAGQTIFGLLIHGEGKAWLDEISLSGGATLPEEDISRFTGPPPEVVHVGLVAPNMLCVEVRDMQHVWGKLEPYKAQEGDEIKVTERSTDGTVRARALHRNGRKIGGIVGPEGNLHVHTARHRVTGRPLHRNQALKPDTWSLTTAGGRAVVPMAVHLKQKPMGPSGAQTRVSWYVLTFAGALAPGAYALNVGQYDLRQQFDLSPATLRSEAIHVPHTGYRPDDPVKVGFLSYWTGTGGAVTYAADLPFSLADARTGEHVHSGTTRLRMARDQASYGLHAKGRNYALSDVWVCDFSAFGEPGEYVLVVDGIGCSFPFRIDRTAWDVPTKASLRGFFHQRAGQEWRKPWADWDQPRAFHPGNGEVFWELSKSQLDIALQEGKRHEDVMAEGRFDEWKTGRTIENAWGGYYDAGDFDRHTAHLVCSRNMLELLELFPDYYRAFSTPVPEADNDLPDLMDEALWAIDLYKRTQREDGAVYGGIETNGHPNAGEPAFLDSLTRYVFAPDPRACWRYTASAARAALVLRGLGQSDRARDYLSSAVRAMDWGEQEYNSRQAYFEKARNWWEIKDDRNLAAVTLYRMTQDRRWHELFRQTCTFTVQPTVSQWETGLQEEAAFIYARLPEELTDDTIRRNAILGIEATARKQVQYSDGIPFMWTGPNGDPGFPLILSINAAPWGQPLCRAYTLTGKREYLEYAIRTALNSVGANPQNMTFTTRLGHRSPQFPLQCSRISMHAPEPYTGYTVYGLHLMGQPPSWVKQWFVTPLNSAPEMGSWPVAESYWDVQGWPMVNENTVHQSMAPAVYVWGYLAAREQSR